MNDAPSDKQAVRERVLAARAALTGDERAAKSGTICAAVERIGAYAGAKTVLFYMPIRGEVDIAPLMAGALGRGVRCALPRCGPGRSLRFYCVNDPQYDVEPGYKGIPEPKECLNECNAHDFSVIMVPGAAFDRQGWRVGWGAGYYDRLFALLGRGALRIAPAYAFQVLGRVPRQCHDESVDIIVTEDEVIDCRKAGGEPNG